MARPANTYRAARRNAWRKAKLIWRAGRSPLRDGVFNIGSHASLPPQAFLAKPSPQKAAA